MGDATPPAVLARRKKIASIIADMEDRVVSVAEEFNYTFQTRRVLRQWRSSRGNAARLRELKASAGRAFLHGSKRKVVNSWIKLMTDFALALAQLRAWLTTHRRPGSGPVAACWCRARVRCRAWLPAAAAAAIPHGRAACVASHATCNIREVRSCAW